VSQDSHDSPAPLPPERCFGVELAKVTLMLAKKLALDEARETLGELVARDERARR
jgi:hypothetical protein